MFCLILGKELRQVNSKEDVLRERRVAGSKIGRNPHYAIDKLKEAVSLHHGHKNICSDLST